MAVKWIPEGYHVVTPYFVVPGAGEFIEFLKEAFGAQERERFGRPDGAIMHAEVSIGDSVIMLGDASPEFAATRSSTHLYVDDVDASYDRALQAGGESLREPQDQFYGDRSAGIKDRFGNQWWLATHVEDVSMEEMQRRQAAMAQA
jgi:PhnB protein